MIRRRRTPTVRPTPDFTRDEALHILQVLPRLGGVRLEGAVVDENFLAQVRAAYEWATTWPGRTRTLTRDTFYNIRHEAANDMKSPAMTDPSFAVGAALAGWIPALRYDRDMCPRFTGMRRGAL